MTGSFKKHLPAGQDRAGARRFRAVDGISVVVNRGESVGIVGEMAAASRTTFTMGDER